MWVLPMNRALPELIGYRYGETRVYGFQFSLRVYIMVHRLVWKMYYPLRWDAEVDPSLHFCSL